MKMLWVLGCAMTFSGIAGFLFPDLVFRILVIPLAVLFSQIGRIRFWLTPHLVYAEWIRTGIFSLTLMGVLLLVFVFIWRRIENESGECFPQQPLTQHKQKEPGFYLVALGLIILLGACLRLVNMNQSLWNDEIQSVISFIHPFKFWRYLELGDHWLNTFLGYITIPFLGESEFSLRLPEFLMGVITIPVIYWFARDFLSAKVGILAAFLLSVSVFHIRHSNEAARGYTALVLFTLLSSYFFLRLITDRYPDKRRQDRLFLCIFTALGALSHFYYIWTVMAQVLTILSTFVIERFFRKEQAVRFRSYTMSNLLAIIIFGYLISLLIIGPNFLRGLLDSYWNFKWAGKAISFETVGMLFTGKRTFSYGLIFSILAITTLIALWKLRRYTLAKYLFFLTVLPMVIVKLVMKVTFTRYFIFMLPILLVLLAYTIVLIADAIKEKTLRIFVLLALVGIFTFLQLDSLMIYYQHRNSGSEDCRLLGRTVDSLAQGNDTVAAIGLGNETVQYYIKKHKVLLLDNQYELLNLVRDTKGRVWVVVKFAEFLPLFYEQFRVFRYIQEHFVFFREFSGEVFSISLYVSKN